MKPLFLLDIMKNWSDEEKAPKYSVLTPVILTQGFSQGVYLTTLDAGDPLCDLITDLRPGCRVIVRSDKSGKKMSSATSIEPDSLCENLTSARTSSTSLPASVTSEMMGSPLRMQEFAELNLNDSQEEVFVREKSVFEERGFPIGKMRNIVSQLSCAHVNVPVAVVCDGKNPDGLVCVHYKPRKKHNVFTFWSFRVYDRSEKPITATWLRSLHASNVASKHSTMNCSASYNIRSIAQTDGSSALIRLEAVHDTAHHLLDQPPGDAVVSISIRAVPGCKESRLNSLYRELNILKGFCQAMKDRQISWLIEHREEPVQTSVEKLFEKMTNLKSSVPSPLDVTANETAAMGDATVMPEIELLAEVGVQRTLQDFTEQLWPILIDCSSYKELCTALLWLFHRLKSSRIIPVVEPTNQSELARLFRSADESKEFNAPSLIDLTPLNLLIEIGIFKLRRDYIHYFYSHDVLCSDLMTYYNDVAVAMDEQVARLLKLHAAMETVAMARQYLHDLDKAAVSDLSRHCLQYYQKAELSRDHVFTVPIHYKGLAKITSSLPPSTWHLELESQTEDGISLRTSCLLTDAPPSGCGVELIANSDSPDEDLTNRRYCLTQINDIIHERIWQNS